jgi:hypothetical protein
MSTRFGPTDGTFECGLCGEWMTGCALCDGAPLVDVRPRLEAEMRAKADTDQEMRRQELAIRRAAEARSLT